VLGDAHGGLRRLVVGAGGAVDQHEQSPRPGEARLVVARGEVVDRPLRTRDDLHAFGSAGHVEVQRAPAEHRHRPEPDVLKGVGGGRCLREDRSGLLEAALLHQRVGEVGQELDSRGGVDRQEGRGSTKEVARRRRVAARERAPAGR
jgi:hypothetical protein